MLTNPITRFRMLSFAEGFSFIALLIFGSLLSRVSDIHLVGPLGALHGALFAALVVVTLTVRRRLAWGMGATLLALLAAALPLGPFVLHYVRRDQLRAAEQSLTA